MPQSGTNKGTQGYTAAHGSRHARRYPLGALLYPHPGEFSAAQSGSHAEALFLPLVRRTGPRLSYAPAQWPLGVQKAARTGQRPGARPVAEPRAGGGSAAFAAFSPAPRLRQHRSGRRPLPSGELGLEPCNPARTRSTGLCPRLATSACSATTHDVTSGFSALDRARTRLERCRAEHSERMNERIFRSELQPSA